MANLGSFGAAVRELDPGAERDTFDFFDETFTVSGLLPPVLMLQLGAAATGKIDQQEGMGAIWEAMRCSLTAHPEGSEGEPDPSEFERWYRLAVDKMASLDNMIRLAMALFESQAGRPTQRQPDSTDGLSSTSPNANPSSSDLHPALQHLRPVGQMLAG